MAMVVAVNYSELGVAVMKKEVVEIDNDKVVVVNCSGLGVAVMEKAVVEIGNDKEVVVTAKVAVGIDSDTLAEEVMEKAVVEICNNKAEAVMEKVMEVGKKVVVVVLMTMEEVETVMVVAHKAWEVVALCREAGMVVVVVQCKEVVVVRCKEAVEVVNYVGEVVNDSNE